MSYETPISDRARTFRARYLGADAAASVPILLTAAQAADIAAAAEGRTTWDVVSDIVRTPDLSGEYADDPTPESLARELGADPEDDEQVDRLVTAWEYGRDLVWSRHVKAAAYRTLGEVGPALRLETSVDEHTRQLGYSSEAAEDAAQAVARGARAIDELGERPLGTHAPRWDVPVGWRIAVAAMGENGGRTMGSDDDCVLARVMRSAGHGEADNSSPYIAGLELLGIATDAAWEYGFDVGGGTHVHFDVLAQAWNELLGLTWS